MEMQATQRKIFHGTIKDVVPERVQNRVQKGGG